jgi:D-cysteine desulfhydrase
MIALVRRFPALADRLPIVTLTELPTPVHRLARLGEGGAAELWIKRDDRTSPVYGGNKARKLELLLGEARRRRARTVLTFGGLGTHHGLATTIYAREVGMRTILVLVPQPVTPAVRETLLCAHGFGAELRLAANSAHAAAIGAGLLARGVLTGDRPFLIPPGGSSVEGTLGFVGAGVELAEQVQRGELPEPDRLFVALGSGGTVAGLALGLRLGGLRKTRVAAVLVTDILPPSQRRLLALARGALARLRALAPEVPDVVVEPETIEIDARFRGPGYGVATPEAEAARAAMAEREGIAVENTYTAKALAALLAHAARPAGAGERLLFWNTYAGSCPAPPSPSDPAALPEAFRRILARGP